MAARLGLDEEDEAEEGLWLSPLEEAAKFVDTCHFDVDAGVPGSGLRSEQALPKIVGLFYLYIMSLLPHTRSRLRLMLESSGLDKVARFGVLCTCVSDNTS